MFRAKDDGCIKVVLEPDESCRSWGTARPPIVGGPSRPVSNAVTGIVGVSTMSAAVKNSSHDRAYA